MVPETIMDNQPIIDVQPRTSKLAYPWISAQDVFSSPGLPGNEKKKCTCDLEKQAGCKEEVSEDVEKSNEVIFVEHKICEVCSDAGKNSEKLPVLDDGKIKMPGLVRQRSLSLDSGLGEFNYFEEEKLACLQATVRKELLRERKTSEADAGNQPEAKAPDEQKPGNEAKTNVSLGVEEVTPTEEDATTEKKLTTLNELVADTGIQQPGEIQALLDKINQLHKVGEELPNREKSSEADAGIQPGAKTPDYEKPGTEEKTIVSARVEETTPAEEDATNGKKLATFAELGADGCYEQPGEIRFTVGSDKTNQQHFVLYLASTPNTEDPKGPVSVSVTLSVKGDSAAAIEVQKPKEEEALSELEAAAAAVGQANTINQNEGKVLRFYACTEDCVKTSTDAPPRPPINSFYRTRVVALRDVHRPLTTWSSPPSTFTGKGNTGGNRRTTTASSRPNSKVGSPPQKKETVHSGVLKKHEIPNTFAPLRPTIQNLSYEGTRPIDIPINRDPDRRDPRRPRMGTELVTIPRPSINRSTPRVVASDQGPVLPEPNILCSSSFRIPIVSNDPADAVLPSLGSSKRCCGIRKSYFLFVFAGLAFAALLICWDVIRHVLK